MSELIGSRYAHALFDAGKDLDLVDTFETEMKELVNLLAEEQDLVALMRHPEISKTDKKTVIDNVFKGNISDYLLNFLKILIDKNRFNDLESIQKSYKTLYNREEGIVDVVATTHIAMDQEKIDKLRDTMSKKLDKKVNVINKIDPDILGGMILDYDGQRIDKSLIEEISEIERVLKQ